MVVFNNNNLIFMGVFNNYKNSNYKKAKKESTKIRNMFL